MYHQSQRGDLRVDWIRCCVRSEHSKLSPQAPAPSLPLSGAPVRPDSVSQYVGEERGNVEKHQQHHEQVRQVVRALLNPMDVLLDILVNRFASHFVNHVLCDPFV